jgi:hypothetical protein
MEDRFNIREIRKTHILSIFIILCCLAHPGFAGKRLAFRTAQPSATHGGDRKLEKRMLISTGLYKHCASSL